jgi:hypothetical protein
VNIGNLDMLLNSGLVVVGDAEEATRVHDEDDVAGRAVTGLTVKARAQVRPVRVRLWLDAGPAVGPCVFDGTMIFPGGFVCLSDGRDETLYLRSTGRVRPDGHPVCVYADDDEAASRIDLLIDADGPPSALTAVPGYELAPVRVSTRGLQTADELGLILDSCDRPFARLAAAMKLALAARDQPPPERAAAVNTYRARKVAEWMRELGAEIPTSRMQALAALIDDRLTHSPTDDLDRRAVDLATETVRAARLQEHVHDPGPTPNPKRTARSRR